MSATATAAARSVLRSAATASRVASEAKPRTAASSAFSPFRSSKQSSHLLNHRIFRSPVELSFVETMLPYHTATASALLTSMLSVSRPIYGWTSEDY